MESSGMEIFSVAALLLLLNVWCGGMRKHARPAGLSALLRCNFRWSINSSNPNFVINWFVEP